MRFRGTSAPLVNGDQRSPPHEQGAHATYEIGRLARELKPFKLHWFPTIGSTNTRAALMRREKRLLAPAVLLTGRQTAGRGRGVNVWHSPRGVITATFVLPAHDTLPPQHVPLVAGLAVLDAVIEQTQLAGVGIKWPNDLWHDDRKFAGLLCERIDGVDLIGVGLNANLDLAALPTPIRKQTTSLHAIAGGPVDQTDLVAAIARQLRRALGDARTSLAAIHDRLTSLDLLRGRPVRVTRENEPVVEGVGGGIDSGGRLIVRHGARSHAIVSGTVRPLL